MVAESKGKRFVWIYFKMDNSRRVDGKRTISPYSRLVWYSIVLSFFISTWIYLLVSSNNNNKVNNNNLNFHGIAQIIISKAKKYQKITSYMPKKKREMYRSTQFSVFIFITFFDWREKSQTLNSSVCR